MKEDFLHFLWKYRLLDNNSLQTTDGQPMQIISQGTHNPNSGPDFSAARIQIGDTHWAGNVEMHMQSSDWYRHNHHTDDAYAGIILHVVMQHDQEISDKSGNAIPVLEIKHSFHPALAGKYEKIISAKTWIPCARFIQDTDPMIMMNWLSRLQVERLENKSAEILEFFRYFENNWEQTLYYFLARNFGFRVNATPFALLAQRTPYLILAKYKNDLTRLEALLFGQAGMLKDECKDAYPALLKREYEFLKHKHQLVSLDKSLWKFGKLRPPNFPTLRIAQFAKLIHQSSGLFAKLIETNSVRDIHHFFELQCSPYWNNHYVFDSLSRGKVKKMGADAVENIIINTLVPIKFVYGAHSMKPVHKDQAVALLAALPPEKNTIISKWRSLNVTPLNAAESQALLELKKYYCTPKKCLSCAVGLHLIKKSS